MPSSLVARSTARAKAAGFTLIELMIAMAVGILLLLALATLFASNSGNQQELERTVRQLENARFALDTLGEDLMHAGFYSDFNPNTLVNGVAYQTPDPCAVATNAQGWNTAVAATAAIQVPVPIQGVASGAAVGCLANRLAGTEALTLRRAVSGPTIPLASANSSNVYVQVSRCNTDTQRVLAAAAPSASPGSTFTLRNAACSAVNDAVRRVSQRTYYVASCNDCAAADGIPTLKRVEMIDGVLRTTAIAEGVENFQVEYGLDTDNNGSPNNYVTLGSGSITGVAQWQNVVAVRLHLLTRNTQATSGYADTRTYRLGPDVAVAAPSDGFKRTLSTTTVRLHNVAGRRE